MSANDDLMLDVSQAHELKMAFRRAGWSNKEIKTLSEGSVLSDVLKVIKGYAQIIPIEHFIDTDKTPHIPLLCSIEEHRTSGLLKFDPDVVTLYLEEEQKKRNGIDGDILRQKLSDKQVMNANVLDYLLENPGLIPKEWERKRVFFWGTIYKNCEGDLFVRSLDSTGGTYGSNRNKLDDGFLYCDYTVIVN